MSGKPFVLANNLFVYSKTKVCRECREEKPNDADHFPKKLHGFRDRFTTADVCKVCKNRRISETLKRNAREKL